MIKRNIAIMVLLALVLSACAVQPQETSAPTETTAPTQPTEATKPTEPPTQPTEPPTQPTEPPTEPPTQPTEPELSYYEQVQTYTPISGYSTKVCWGKVLNNEVHGSMPSCKLITSGKVDSSQIYSLAQGWCSTTSTNSDCPLSFDELSAQYSDKFFETHFLFVAKIFSDAPPAIDRILVGDPVFFKNTMIVVYNADTPNSGPSNVYYVFIEVPRAYLNDANKYTMMWDREIESLKKGPTEPPTQPTEPTEPTTVPELDVRERIPSQPLTTPVLLKCDYKISIIDMPYEKRLERWWGGSTTLTSLKHVNSFIEMYEGRGYDLTVKNALCPQSYTEIRDIFVDEVHVPNEVFFKDYALVEILVTNPEGVLPKIEKIEFCKECVEPMDGWYVRIYVDAEPPSLTDPVYSIWVKIPWTINGIKMEPGAQVGGHYFVYTYLLQ